jgi:hypothetical protein
LADEVLASAATVFCFNEAESSDTADSETSPISKVSGRLPEDSTSSNYMLKTINSQKLDLKQVWYQK